MSTRGSRLDSGNRFTASSREAFDDGWGDQEDRFEVDPRTRILDDSSRNAFAQNSSPDIPFTHSINPYRGCEHGCSYCLDGETPILMADGTQRPLADLKVGDLIYGTRMQGDERRLTITDVRDHWRSVKPAHRITLANGTELIASGDHRFLSERGWRSVIPSDSGSHSYSGLQVGEKLMGVDQDIASINGKEIAGHIVASDEGMEIVGIEKLEGTRELFDITTGTEDFIANGVVSHNCYARPTHEYLGFNAGIDFESIIMVKRDVARLARAAMMKRSWTPTTVSISGVTDAYQPLERRLGLTRQVLETMLDFRNPVGIVTKNAGVCRDIDLLAELARHECAVVFLSITTLDADLAGRMEPRTSRPAQRLKAIEKLTAAGIPVGVMVAPIIPGLTDEEAPAILKAAADAGARWAGHVLLRLPLSVKPVFLDWLDREEPDRSAKVRNALREMKGETLNESRFKERMKGVGPRAEAIARLFRISAERAGMNREDIPLSTEHFRRPGSVEQLELF